MSSNILRWSVWGNAEHVDIMLSHSIATFRRFFGEGWRYVVCAENRERVEASLLVPAEVIDVRQAERFSDPHSTWRKWRPAARLDPDVIEIYVDADMFLLDEPIEIQDFCDHPDEYRFLCTSEPFEVGYYGNFAAHVDPALPLVNAGLIGQQARADLTAALGEQYAWWRQNVPVEAADYHDEQGAVRKALETHLRNGEVAVLSSDRYRVVCPLNDPPVTSLDGIVLLHATFPHRPAFWQFRREIAAVSGIR
jgi:hypothetical protein